VKVPGSELARVLLADSLCGANWPGSEKAVNRVSRVMMGPGVKCGSVDLRMCGF